MLNHLNFLKNEKFLLFSAGVVTTLLGSKIQKSPKTRKVVVGAVAKCMQLQKDAQEAIINMKEEAQDICHDAKIEANRAEPDIQ
ncbi:MAG: DUF6110 family protein [Thermotaleaceae bacterium]